jgi:hypothetical protein
MSPQESGQRAHGRFLMMAITSKTLDTWLAILTAGLEAHALIEPNGPLNPLSPEAVSWRERCSRIAQRHKPGPGKA